MVEPRPVFIASTSDPDVELVGEICVRPEQMECFELTLLEHRGADLLPLDVGVVR